VNRRRTGLLAGALAALTAAGIYWRVGSTLIAAAPHKPLPPPADMPAELVSLDSSSGARLVAWLFTPPSPQAAVVVLHGVRAHRGTMLNRAELFFRAGYAVLVPDFRAHGESTGDAVTFGARESRDALAAVAFLRQRFPSLRIGAVGVSMGGAALVLAGRQLTIDACVLEAVYPTIEEAVSNRIAMRLGPVLSTALAPVLLLQLKPRLGIGPEELRPVTSIHHLRAPVLIVSGEQDAHTTAAQTQALFAAAGAPKELWMVPGATHDDLLRHDPEGYARRVIAFLDRYLATSPAPSIGEQ
jgi:alpha-beta hydrolase superfamily lysophospholipase